MKQDALQRILAATEARQPVVTVTDIEDGAQTIVTDGAAHGDLALTPDVMAEIETAIGRDRCTTIEMAGRKLFLQVLNPPKRLAVIGAVHIAQTLVPMAIMAGYDVTVIDPRGAWATEERFPDAEISREWPDKAMEALAPDHRTAVVALTHDPKLDEPGLGIALKSQAFYIGALGSNASNAARLGRLKKAGFGPDELARIHGPVGLDIHAESPPEIAVAILAQMTQVLHPPKKKKGKGKAA